MITINDIGWGHYMDHEGPFYRGNEHYSLSANPTTEEVYLAVITATEGGTYNAVNMYDRCGVSLGLIQWCEFGQFSVSALLGGLEDFGVLDALVNDIGYTFHPYESKYPAGSPWRFFRREAGQSYPVDTIDKQRRLFFLNASGMLGSWDEESKAYAKRWAVVLASIFEDTDAQDRQLAFTLARLDGFVLPNAIMLNPKRMVAGAALSPWAHVAYAAYLSFAANNPTIANKMFQMHIQHHGFNPTDKDWVIGLLKQLTFGPQFTIYPARYNAIRPVLEKNFAVDLPDFQLDLYRWGQMMGVDPEGPVITTVEVQKALETLGYDLGPADVDGKFGPKTRQAVIIFQKQQGLTPDGIVGPLTRGALLKALEKGNI